MTEHGLLATIITKEVQTRQPRPSGKCALRYILPRCHYVLFLVSLTACEAAAFSLRDHHCVYQPRFSNSLSVTALRHLFILSLSLPYSLPNIYYNVNIPLLYSIIQEGSIIVYQMDGWMDGQMMGWVDKQVNFFHRILWNFDLLYKQRNTFKSTSYVTCM